MKTTAAAIVALTITAAAANADWTVNFPGTYQFSASNGMTVTVPAVSGTLYGVRVQFTYLNPVANSTAYDVAFTVNDSQWGGYYPLINGAHWGETPTGAPTIASPLTYVSGNLGMGYGVAFNNQNAIVGFGNANSGGGCTLTNVSITLLGVIPTPGAAAALGLGGLLLGRRRR